MSDSVISISLGPRENLFHLISPKIGQIVDLNVGLNHIQRAKNARVRFRFWTGQGISVWFDAEDEGRIVFPVGVAFNNQTTLIEAQEVMPKKESDPPFIDQANTMFHMFTAYNGAHIASPNYVTNWLGWDGVVKVIFKYKK